MVVRRTCWSAEGGRYGIGMVRLKADATASAVRAGPEGRHYRRCESYGFPVNGSFGAVGFASNASRLGTTSITPYMRT